MNVLKYFYFRDEILELKQKKSEIIARLELIRGLHKITLGGRGCTFSHNEYIELNKLSIKRNILNERFDFINSQIFSNDCLILKTYIYNRRYLNNDLTSEMNRYKYSKSKHLNVYIENKRIKNTFFIKYSGVTIGEIQVTKNNFIKNIVLYNSFFMPLHPDVNKVLKKYIGLNFKIYRSEYEHDKKNLF